MATNSITINLPDTVYQRARRATTLLNRSVEELLEAPADLIARLPLSTDAGLWQVARSRMDTEDETLLHELLDTQAERELTNEEARQLEVLRQHAGRLTIIKSQVYSLLHQRGYPAPPP